MLRESLATTGEQGHDNTDNQGFIYRLWGEKQFSSGTVFLDYKGGYTENYFGLRDSGFYEFWGITTGVTYNYENILTFRADGSFANNDYIQAPIERLQEYFPAKRRCVARQYFCRIQNHPVPYI